MYLQMQLGLLQLAVGGVMEEETRKRKGGAMLSSLSGEIKL